MTCTCGTPGCSGTAAYDPAPVPVYAQVSSPADAARLTRAREMAAAHELPEAAVVTALITPVVPLQRTGGHLPTPREAS